MTLHVNHLPSRRFTCNVNHYFLWKIWKTCFENVVCQSWSALKRLIWCLTGTFRVETRHYILWAWNINSSDIPNPQLCLQPQSRCFTKNESGLGEHFANTWIKVTCGGCFSLKYHPINLFSRTIVKSTLHLGKNKTKIASVSQKTHFMPAVHRNKYIAFFFPLFFQNASTSPPPSPTPMHPSGAVIDSVSHLGQGVYSGTFSGMEKRKVHHNLFITQFVITRFRIQHGLKMEPKNE